MIVPLVFMPARCCTAPEMPNARYTRRLDGAARLPDLARARHPAGVDQRPGDAKGRAHLGRKPLELFEVLLLADAAADGQDEVGAR